MAVQQPVLLRDHATLFEQFPLPGGDVELALAQLLLPQLEIARQPLVAPGVADSESSGRRCRIRRVEDRWRRRCRRRREARRAAVGDCRRWRLVRAGGPIEARASRWLT